MSVSSKEFLDIQATIESGFTLKHERDMIRTCSLTSDTFNHHPWISKIQFLLKNYDLLKVKFRVFVYAPLFLKNTAKQKPNKKQKYTKKTNKDWKHKALFFPLNLTHFSPNFHFNTPENDRKLLLFWHFQGV